MLQHAREIAPSVSWEILVRVKRSGGMSVNELAAELKMSYMGVKQHCDDLRKQGYVDTWRRPKGTGRPEKIYRPTPKLDLVLTNWGSELCLGVLALAAQAYGEAAPDRLLYGYFQQKTARWAAKLKGKTVKDRLAELVKFRNADGWMSELVVDEEGLHLFDHHSPLAEVARLYPNVWEMEARALERLLDVTLERRTQGNRHELLLPVAMPAGLPVEANAELGRNEEDREVAPGSGTVPQAVEEVSTSVTAMVGTEEPVPLKIDSEIESANPPVESDGVRDEARVAVALAEDGVAPVLPEASSEAEAEVPGEPEPEVAQEPGAAPEETLDEVIYVMDLDPDAGPSPAETVPGTRLVPGPEAPANVPVPGKKAAAKAGRAVQAELFDF